MSDINRETNISFPTDFPIKIMGYSHNLEEIALPIINKHAANGYSENIKLKPSKNGKYVSITVTIYAKSKEQIDNLYKELSKHPDILMVL